MILPVEMSPKDMKTARQQAVMLDIISSAAVLSSADILHGTLPPTAVSEARYLQAGLLHLRPAFSTASTAPNLEAGTWPGPPGAVFARHFARCALA